MDNIVKYYSGIDRELRRRRGLVTATLAFAAAVCIGVVLLSFRFVSRSRDTVYVVDKGSTLMATIAEGDVQRDLEVEDHIRRFHELMFNLAPSSESQKRNLEQALHMADRSAYDWWQDQSESGYYSRLVSANISQEIRIDSVRFSMQQYPYPARLYGKVFLTRESNITAYDFVSECRLSDVPRSRSNPHGLMVERFAVKRYESLGTRRRR
jgi:conjugative transposon TraK protein